MGSLPFDLLHNIGMCHVGPVHHNKLKPVLVQLTKHNPFLRASTSYKLKYAPFDYFMHYEITKYAWADKNLDPNKSNNDRKWGKAVNTKHEPV